MASARRSESQGPASTSNLPPDVITALTTLHDFVTASMQLPPQVIVTCRNEKRAFGRSALQAMSYRVYTILPALRKQLIAKTESSRPLRPALLDEKRLVDIRV